jgi:hypothetical protein
MTAAPHDLNLLAAFAEDRLSEAERQTLIAHLAGCAECRATLASFARASTPAAVVPVTATDAPSSWRDGWMSIAAMLVMTTIGGTLALRGPGPGTRPVSIDPPPAAPARPASEPRDPQAPPAGRGSTSAPSSPSGAPGSTPAPGLRRGTERVVGGKTFSLVAGDWIDRAFNPVALLPAVDAPTPADRDALLAKVPALRPYAALGPRVLVVHEGTVYRLGPVERR